MAGAHPGGAVKIRFIKPVAEWAFVQVAFNRNRYHQTFYSFGCPLSVFAQLRVEIEEDLLPDTFDELSAGQDGGIIGA